jgi:electron transport complex protein RnfC
MRDLGLAGLGGAVFPSYIKLNPAGQRIHTLILNGAECEPWITCDDRLMRERAADTLQGRRAIMRHLLGARTVLIGIETTSLRPLPP